LTTLVDKKQYQNCLDILHFLLEFLRQNESNTIQYLKSRVYFYFSLVNEKMGKMEDVISEFNSAYRKACLDLDEITQNTLINCITRFLLENNAYEQARNFLSKTKFHENILTNEDARYLYYLGRINAVQLNYSEAYKNLTDSLRKSPEKSARGFTIIIQKLLVIIEMLMGDVPDITKYLGSIKEMGPYCNLIKAVSQGNLEFFNQVVTQNKVSFLADKNYNLIQKLRYVVIKVGLRKINLSYNRISLEDVCQKLHLDSQLETEYIVGKVRENLLFRLFKKEFS
jgi:26S proteasome regulatory subunit N3